MAIPRAATRVGAAGKIASDSLAFLLQYNHDIRQTSFAAERFAAAEKGNWNRSTMVRF
jgi:hypothetical protein